MKNISFSSVICSIIFDRRLANQHGKRCSQDGSEALLSVGPRQQLIDIAVGMTIDDAREDVGQIRERVDVVQLAGLDQGRDGGRMLGASIGIREQRVLPAERDRADGALDGVVVEFDTPVFDEAPYTFRSKARDELFLTSARWR
jgi:hypothetical protein